MMTHKIALRVFYIALDLVDDPEADASQYIKKDFELKDVDIEDVMDNIKVYLWKLYQDKTIEVTRWYINCEISKDVH